ncbi:hypothetical protein PanWU01x14_264770 [Parasponia andersonii]|uniref:Uncharacterized protein n=1 Tax=Parasponia andersonii TaxID=3476 RepID=A0A2P5B7B8_PARAD|nr:hypothetical protein PanWU01x14_264770 [Parasponia andersonii]
MFWEPTVIVQGTQTAHGLGNPIVHLEGATKESRDELHRHPRLTCVMSSSEDFREGNAFLGESSNTSISSINFEDYLELEPEVEITRVRQSSPRIGDLPQDQWPSISEMPLHSQRAQQNLSQLQDRHPLSSSHGVHRPHTLPSGIASFSEAVLKSGVHLPLHPYIKSIVDYYRVIPFQLTLNTYRYMVDNREQPGLSREQLARVNRINDLPIEEFDWKKLGTSKNLVACGLLPKGAAFLDPTIHSSRPSSSKKKKPRKETEKNASSSKPRKQKAPTTPSTSEPSSPEIASPPASQHGIRAPPSTLGSMAKSKTPESIPPSSSKGKKKPQIMSHLEPSKETATSSEPNQVDKDEELFALLNQLPEKAERRQLLEGLAKEKSEKEKLEEKIKDLEKTISEHPDRMEEATTEAAHKAIEEFKATEVKELEDKASDIALSTIIYNIFCEHLDFDFSILGEDVSELVHSWREDEATKTEDGGASTSAQ